MSESRLSRKLQGQGREDRSNGDATRQPAENKLHSAQERRRAWSEEWTQSALPKLPEMEGWHMCWLSTSNSYDSIDKRMRLGYVPVKADELPGYEQYRVKEGEHVGFISCNEMLLFKLPMDIYQEAMTHMHFDLPNEEAEKMRVNLAALQGSQEGRDSTGKRLLSTEGEGMGTLGFRPKETPIFSG